MSALGGGGTSLEFDHVIIVVDDLDAAAGRFTDDYGLAYVEGGRHAGHGTANRIVPLGGAYVELMGVVDQAEAGSSRLGRFVLNRTSGGDQVAALCLRTSGLADICSRLGLESVAMTRDRPDGVQLAWHLAGLDEALGTEALPFFIQWQIDASDHPGRMTAEHDRAPRGIEWVEIGGPEEILSARLGTHDLDIRSVRGAPGVRRVALGVEDGVIEI